MLKRSIVILLAALSAACTSLPRAEFQAYRDAFQAAQAAAVPMAEAYAVNERAQNLNVLKGTDSFNSEREYFTAFDASAAADAATIGLPPGADAIDRTYRAIARYNDALVALAENRNIDEAQGQINQILADFAPLPGLAEIAPGVGTAMDAVRTALTPVIQEENRRMFKDRVLGGAPAIRQLIGALRDHTPTQYLTTVRALEARYVREQANRPAIVREINGWHTVFANYVMLLNAMERRLTDLETAVREPRHAPALEQASSYAADLRVHAEALRRSIVELRAPR